MTNEMLREGTKSLIATVIVVGALFSLLYPSVGEVGARILQSLATLVVGYYFGSQTIPFAGFRGILGGKTKKTK
jgi:hypothetical protein